MSTKRSLLKVYNNDLTSNISFEEVRVDWLGYLEVVGIGEMVGSVFVRSRDNNIGICGDIFASWIMEFSTLMETF